MRNRIRFLCVLLSLISVISSSCSIVNVQETIAHVLEEADVTSVDEISELLQRSELAAVLNAFAFDLEAHVDYTVEQFMDAYFGNPFKIPRLNDDGSISSNDGVFFIPILNGEQVLATVTVGVEENDEVYFSVSAGYARGLTKLLDNSSSNSFDLVFTENGYRLFGSDGNVIVDIINSALVDPTELLVKTQSQKDDYSLEQLFDSVRMYSIEKLDLYNQNDIDKSLVSQKIDSLYTD